MRILNISNLYPPHHIGGAELGTHNLAKSWAAHGHDVHALSLCEPTTVAYAEEVDGVTSHRIPLANDYWPFDDAKPRAKWARLKWHIRDIENRTAATAVSAACLAGRVSTVSVVCKRVRALTCICMLYES